MSHARVPCTFADCRCPRLFAFPVRPRIASWRELGEEQADWIQLFQVIELGGESDAGIAQQRVSSLDFVRAAADLEAARRLRLNT